ncbi:MAG: hypothetical protein WCT14_21485 [Treponemataceae bacterium]
MPAQILHVLFGEDVLNRTVSVAGEGSIGAYVGRVLGEMRVFFALGCQGPDLFYHNQRTRPLSIEYGTLLHRRGYGSFATALLRRTMSAHSPSSGPSAGAAYALGFATHAFLDRAAHPYIVCKSGWVSPSKPETARYARCHAFFERILDVQMLEKLRGMDASAWDQEERLTRYSDTERASLIEAVGASLTEAFPERASADVKLSLRVANAFSDAESFYHMTNPMRTSLNMRLSDGFEYLSSASGRASVALIYPERFPLGIDYLNLARAPWAHPCRADKIDHRSFPDMYEDAVQYAVSVFIRILGGFVTSGLLENDAAFLIGNAGLSAVGEDGQPCAPTHAEPLPLDSVLDEQYRFRLKWIAARGLLN